MCERKPGNRCSNHQGKRLHTAIVKMVSTLDKDPAAQLQGFRGFRKELIEFNSTPAGQKILKQRLETAEPHQKERIIADMRAGEKLRKARKIALDTNGEEIVTTVPEELDNNEIRRIGEELQDYSKHMSVVKKTAKPKVEQKPVVVATPVKQKAKQTDLKNDSNLAHAKTRMRAINKSGRTFEDLTPDEKAQFKIDSLRIESEQKAEKVKREQQTEERSFVRNVRRELERPLDTRNLDPKVPEWKNRSLVRIQRAKRFSPEILEAHGPRIRKEIERLNEEDKNSPLYSRPRERPVVEEPTIQSKIKGFFEAIKNSKVTEF